MRIFVSDCEGPLSKNDNAFEVSAHFIPRGNYFFSLISKYDDVLADVVRRPEYRAGDTLKLITPFLRAYDVTNRELEEFSAENVILIHGAKEALRLIRGIMPSFIVSTSYTQYMYALCAVLDFPWENVRCTKLDLDRYCLKKAERERLRLLTKEIVELPMIDIPDGAESLSQLPAQSREVVEKLDDVFWEEISHMKAGALLREVQPVGGQEKAEAINEIVSKLNCGLDEVMYVGDSITDVQAFHLVRESGGLAVSFNGNAYAVRSSDVAVLSESATVTAALAAVFSELGRGGVLDLLGDLGYPALCKFCPDKEVLKAVSAAYPDGFPRAERITIDNENKLVRESSSFRKNVRGDAIGKLG